MVGGGVVGGDGSFLGYFTTCFAYAAAAAAGLFYFYFFERGE